MADDASPATRPQPTAETEASPPPADGKAKARRRWLTRLFILLVVAGGAATAWYLLVGRGTVKTDNAYVAAELATVTPFVGGQVVEVNVSDTDRVTRGDVLVTLDDTDARIAISQAEADLALAQRHFTQTEARNGALSAQVQARFADISQARASFTAAQADLSKATDEYERRLALKDSGAVSDEEVATAERALESAKAAVSRASAAVQQAQASQSAAEGDLSANRALIDGADIETDPAVMAAKAKLDAAKLDLERTIVRAPVDGVIAQRRVQVGQRIAQGTPIMTIVPLSEVYVDANFKEGQLKHVRVGMPATVKADIYGDDVVYHGRVAGLSGATGSAMSLIPAQNATGNWIKVVQRLPVRIALDPNELEAHPLRVGLSTEVEIEVESK